MRFYWFLQTLIIFLTWRYRVVSSIYTSDLTIIASDVDERYYFDHEW